ncbi:MULTISPECIES: RHS repeat domain-containing protein [unclassified Streptomyces]|uniref:RHS repeat domain-containing protein n=1 Tax=unclassified Streptomyces TaxID=2593676 RepID=UPI003719197B
MSTAARPRPAPTGTDYTRTLFEHDASSRLTKMTGPDNAVWSYDYDLRGRKTTEVFTDFTGIFTEGIYGGSPASMALGSYNLDYQLLGVSCQPAKTDSEWDHGVRVGQVQVSVSNTVTRESAMRNPSDDGYKDGSSNSIAKAGLDGVRRIFPDGQKDITVRINWIEEVYLPY